MRRLAIAALLLAACNLHPKTEVMVAIVSDVPEQIDSINVCVSKDGAEPFCTPWTVPAFNLPASYGVYTDDGSEPAVEVTVTGYLGANSIERKARLRLIKEHTLLLRLGILKNCENKMCPAGLTCIEGVCETPDTDPYGLPDFANDPGQVGACMGSSIPAGPGAVPTCSDGKLCLEGGCVEPASTPLTEAGTLKAPTSFVVATDGVWVRTRGTAPDFTDGQVVLVDPAAHTFTAAATGLRSSLDHQGDGWIELSNTHAWFVDSDGTQLARVARTGGAVEHLGAPMAGSIAGISLHADGAEVFYVQGDRLGVWRASDQLNHDLHDATIGVPPSVLGDTVFFVDGSGQVQSMPFDGTTTTPVGNKQYSDSKELLAAGSMVYLAANAETGNGYAGIWATPIDGSLQPVLLAHPDKNPIGLASDGSSMFFVDTHLATICRVSLQGGPVAFLANAYDSNGAIGVDSTFYYWAPTSEGTIRRTRK